MSVIEAGVQPAIEVAVQAGFDYARIDEGVRDEVRQTAKVIKNLGKAMKTSIIMIGQRLIEVKGMLDHGQFGDWCLAEFEMSERTAERMMNVARTYDLKSDIVSFLSDTVLYMLAAPSTPEPVREEIEQRAVAGERITVATVGEVKAKHAPPAETKLDIWQLEERIKTWLAREAKLGEHDGRDADGIIKEIAEQAKSPVKRGTWLDQLIDSIPELYRRNDLLQAINNVREQRRQAARQATLQASGKAVYVAPAPKPRQIDLTPSDLRAEGIVIEEANPNYFRWVDTDEANYRAGALHDTPAQAIANARQVFGIPEADPDEAAAIALVEQEQAEEDAERAERDAGRLPVERVAEAAEAVTPEMPAELKKWGYKLVSHTPGKWGYEYKTGGSYGFADPAVAIEYARQALAREDYVTRIMTDPTVIPEARHSAIKNSLVASPMDSISFHSALHYATVEAITEALKVSNLAKGRREKLEARLRKLEREQPAPKLSSVDIINRDLDAYEAAAQREVEQILSERQAASEQPHPAGILTDAWIVHTLTRAGLESADFVSALKAATAEQIREAEAALPLHGNDERWQRFVARMDELEPSLPEPAPKPQITAMFVDTGKGGRRLTQPELDTINAWPEPSEPVDARVATLTTVDTKSDAFRAALGVATVEQLRAALAILSAQYATGSSRDAWLEGRWDKIANRLEILCPSLPEDARPKSVDPRLAEARAGIAAINAARVWVRGHYHDLTGKAGDELGFWRATDAMVERLESLIAALSGEVADA